MDSNPNKEDRKALIAAAINLVTRTVNDGFHRYLLTQIKQQVASEKITDFRTFMFALKKITATSASVVSSARMMGMAFSDDFQKEDRKRKDKPASVATNGSGAANHQRPALDVGGRGIFQRIASSRATHNSIRTVTPRG